MAAKDAGVEPFPNVRRNVLAATARPERQPVHYARTRYRHARNGICCDRENIGRASSRSHPGWRGFRPPRSPTVTPEFVRDEVARGRAIITSTHLTTPNPSRWRSAATSGQDQRNIGTPLSPPTSRPKSTRWSGRSAGGRHGHGPQHTAEHHTPRMIIRNSPVPIGTVPILPGAEGRWHRRGAQLGNLPRHIDRAGRSRASITSHHAGVRLPYVHDRQSRHRYRFARRFIMAKWCLSHTQGDLHSTNGSRNLRDHEGLRHRLQLGDGLRPRFHRRRPPEQMTRPSSPSFTTLGELTKVAWKHDVQ